MTVRQGMFCRDGFTAKGQVRLAGAEIGGQIDLTGAHLANPGGIALQCERLTVGGSMICRDEFTVEGAVQLSDAEVGGQIDLTGAHLTNPGGIALECGGINVRDMYCQRGFSAEGGVSLFGATVSGQLNFSNSHLHNPSGDALLGNLLTVGKSMYFNDGFIAEGALRLGGAKINGQLSLIGASMHNPGSDAIYAAGIVVENGMFCRDGFTADGCVTMSTAKIGNTLSFRDAVLNNPDGTALDLEAADIADLRLQSAETPHGAVKLTNARLGTLHDDEKTWPTILHLRGSAYETLDNDKIGVRARLRWLTLDPNGYTPQPYDQLAAAYRRSGYREAARRVDVAKQWRRRSALNPLNWLLYLTIGYGYRTWLAGIWLAALAIQGWSIFSRAYPQHMIQATPKAPDFHAFVYAVDVLLPILDLGQEKSWIPEASAQGWSWFLTAAGWLLTSAAVAGLTGIFKRD